MKRDEILKLAIAAVTERSERYGEPDQCFLRIGELWNAWLRIRNGEELTGMDVAVMLMLVKVGRLVGGKEHLDTYIDACGYIACAGELATEKDQENG